jgi:hypothetical protein
MKKLIKVSTLFIISSIFFICCTGKISKANYNKINNGMSKSAVESILGPGESNAASSYGGYSAEVITWQSGMNIISITFSNGKVSGKAQTGL